MPKPPQAPPLLEKLTMSQDTADDATTDMKEQFMDSLVISVDAVDVATLMEKGLKYQQNLSIDEQVDRVKKTLFFLCFLYRNH